MIRKFLFAIALLLFAAMSMEAVPTPTRYLGPRSIQGKWGELTVYVKGKEPQKFKDVMIGTHMEHKWDWSVSGTKHDPGIALPDVKIITAKFTQPAYSKHRYVVMGNGMDSLLKIASESQAYLEDLKASKLMDDFFFLPTPQAMDKFNELTAANDNNVVVGLFHSTC